MKLVILDKDDKGLSGYECVYMDSPQINLSHISDNECSEILIKNCFTQVSVVNAVEFLVLVCSKLRRGGTIKLNGVDARTLARAIVRGNMNDKEFNDIIYSCKSLLSIPTVKDILHRAGLKIETLTLNGINYDITATR